MTSSVTHSLVYGGPEASSSQFIEDLQQCGQGPGLGLTTKWTILAVLIGQLWETLPWRAEEPTKKGRLFAHESMSQHNNHLSITFNNCCAALIISPLQVSVMSGQNTFDHGHSFTVDFFSKLFGKIEFSTQEVANWPEPLLLTNTCKHRVRNKIYIYFI